MHLGFRGKVFIGIVTIVLINALLISLPIRSIVQQSLFREYQYRGQAIVSNLASRSRDAVLSLDWLLLKEVIDGALASSTDLIYAFILDEDERVLSHSFRDGFPSDLRKANAVSVSLPMRIQLLRADKEFIYDFAHIITIGGQKLGTARIGISKSRIDFAIREMMMTILMLTVCSIAAAALIGAGFANQVTYRIKRLQKASEDVLAGNLDIRITGSKHQTCFDLTGCMDTTCPAYGDRLRRCWYIEGTHCFNCPEGMNADKKKWCTHCSVYRQLSGDEIQDLAESFEAMARSLSAHIHELSESRKAIALSEEKYRRIFESSMDMVFATDADGRFFDINQAGIRLLGYRTKEDILNRIALRDIFCQPKEYEDIVVQLETVSFVKDREVCIRSAEGNVLTVLLSCSAQKSGDAITGCEGIVKDITERRNMEQQLLQADKLASLGQLSAGIAHEINNPLGLILGYSQLLLRSQPKDSQLYEDLKTIEKNTLSCKRIVQALLNFARKTETKMAEVDINKAIEQVVAVLDHQFSLSGIDIVLDFDPHLPSIVGDMEKLKQVFMNLVMNARQAIANEGRIRIQTSAQNGRVIVAVSDTGSGIDPAIRHKIFDPFFTTKPTGEGTGLGLSVSYGIVTEHGGDITVESIPGQGSCFTVLLPMPQPEPSKRIQP